MARLHSIRSAVALLSLAAAIHGCNCGFVPVDDRPDSGFDAGVGGGGGTGGGGGMGGGGSGGGGGGTGGGGTGGGGGGDAGQPDAGQPCTTTTRSVFHAPISFYGGVAAGIAFDSSDNLYLAENYVPLSGNPNGSRITRVTAAGNASVLVAPGTISAAAAIAVDAAGNVYVADGNGAGLNNSVPLNKVWKITPDGTPSTFIASVSDPTGLAFDAQGNLYVASYGSNAIYKYDSTGALLGTVASGFTAQPYGITLDAQGNVYVAGFGQSVHGTRIFKATPSGAISTFANAGIEEPYDVAFAPNGALWASYYDGLKLVRVDPDGGVATYPGGWTADDADNGLAFDSKGSLYFVTNGGRTTSPPAVVKLSCVP
jgi:streptogramin lyase